MIKNGQADKMTGLPISFPLYLENTIYHEYHDLKSIAFGSTRTDGGSMQQ